MQSVLSEAVERLSVQRGAIRADHLAGAPGSSTVRRLSDSLDEAVRAIWQESGDLKGSALLALGEYGRQELAPAAELELMILCTAEAEEPNVAAARDLCDQLYGVGIEAAYRVQIFDESSPLPQSGAGFDTAFLDARFLSGEQRLFDDWISKLLENSRRTANDFVEQLARSAESRHLHMDEATASLEPDLKDGKGGLEDLATIGWIQKIRGATSLAASAEDLEDAASYLHRLRSEIHYFTGRNTDLLQMDYQKPVAATLLGEGTTPSPEVALMRSLYDKCRKVAFTMDSSLGRDSSKAEQTARFAAIFGEPGELWPQEALPDFIEILSSEPDRRFCLRTLEHSGALLRAIPEWEGVRCLPQRNIYHRFAVDVHLFETVDAISSLHESPDETVRSNAERSDLKDREVLLLAALLHDIGKGDPSQDHCVRGEKIARTVTARMGLAEPAAADIAWLVGNHLLLAETATKRDIGEEALVADVARQVSSERRLRMLYLLTVADALATGPEAWSTWKATLIRRLFERVSHVLQTGSSSEGGAGELAKARIQELKSGLPEYPGLEDHLAKMPAEWLASQSLSALMRQSRLMMEFRETDELSVNASEDKEAGIWEVIVIAIDRPGLFSKIAGSLALHDLSVVGARVFTRQDGIALDVIRVAALSDEEHRFEHVAEDAKKAMHGKLALDARLAEKRQGQQERPPKGKQEHARIVEDNQASDSYTVIEVHASDRIGRLYGITRAMAELELDIHIAKVSTYAEDIVDVFYVTDLGRRKIMDRDHLAEIETAILHRLQLS